MSERIVNLAWRITIMGLIGSGGVLSLAFGYHGLLDLLMLRITRGLPMAVLGICVAAAVFALCRLRGDLVCD